MGDMEAYLELEAFNEYFEKTTAEPVDILSYAAITLEYDIEEDLYDCCYDCANQALLGVNNVISILEKISSELMNRVIEYDLGEDDEQQG